MLKDIFKKLSRNKIFYIFLFLAIIMFPSTLYLQSDKDTTLIVTTIGIDKDTKSNEYEVTSLAVIPKGSNDISANLETFKAKGKTIAEALDSMSLNCGKKIGLAHCDSIIFSLEVIEENIAKTLDYFIRTSNLTTNATIIATDDKASDLIDATKSSNNLFDLSLKNIINFSEDMSMLDNITIDRFYRTYFGRNTTFFLPILSIEEGVNPTGGESGGAGSEGNSGESSGGSDSSGESKKKIKKDKKILIIKDGLPLRTLTDDETFIYNLISRKSSHIRIEIENINDQYVTNSTESYQQVDKIIVPKYYFEDDKPVVEYSIWLSIMIDEISSTDNHSYSSIDSLQNFLSPAATEEIRKQINEKLEKTNNLMQENGHDIIEAYEHFNAFHTKKWRQYLSIQDDPNNYLKDVTIKIKLNLNYVV